MILNGGQQIKKLTPIFKLTMTITPLRKTLLSIGFACALCSPWIKQCPQFFWQIVLLIFLALFGIPHGALDHFVHRGNNKRSNKTPEKSRISTFLGRYLFMMIIYAAIWWLFPKIAFLLFLMISAFHFADTDLIIDGKSKNEHTWPEKAFYGILILSFIFFPHAEEVSPILSAWSPLTSLILQINIGHRYLDLTPWIMLLIWSVWQVKQNNYPGYGIILQTWILSTTIYFLPLIPAFIFYFTVWHSMISLQSISTHLRQQFSFTARQVFLKAIPLSLLSLCTISIFLWIGGLTFDFSIIFMGTLMSISILTLPHMEIMNTMYYDIKKSDPVSKNNELQATLQ